jgi:hypothetical protein
LGAFDLALFYGEGIIRASLTGPDGKVKMPSRRNSVNADISEGEWKVWFANLGWVHSTKEVHAFSASDNRSLAIRLDQQYKFLIDGHSPWTLGPSVLHDASEEA